MTSGQLPDDFSTNLVNSIFELFVEPEITRRGLALDRDEIRKVVVELSPDRPHPLVRLNDQAKIVASVSVTRDLTEGENVTAADINEVHSVEPEGIGPNSGYVCFAVINGRQCIKFDFRYNKERVARLLLRARQFFDTAADCLETRPAVACDLAFSAAELSVQAQMLLQQQQTKSHVQRQEWIDSWTELDNAPPEHADALRQLRNHRLQGRYEQVAFTVEGSALKPLMNVVEEMIQVAETYAGHAVQ